MSSCDSSRVCSAGLAGLERGFPRNEILRCGSSADPIAGPAFAGGSVLGRGIQPRAGRYLVRCHIAHSLGRQAERYQQHDLGVCSVVHPQHLATPCFDQNKPTNNIVKNEPINSDRVFLFVGKAKQYKSLKPFGLEPRGIHVQSASVWFKYRQ